MMGFQKKNWIVGGWGELYPSLFSIFLTLQAPWRGKAIELVLFLTVGRISSCVAGIEVRRVASTYTNDDQEERWRWHVLDAPNETGQGTHLPPQGCSDYGYVTDISFTILTLR